MSFLDLFPSKNHNYSPPVMVVFPQRSVTEGPEKVYGSLFCFSSFISGPKDDRQ